MFAIKIMVTAVALIIASTVIGNTKAELRGQPLNLSSFTEVDYAKSGPTKRGCRAVFRPSPTKSHDLEKVCPLWGKATHR